MTFAAVVTGYDFTDIELGRDLMTAAGRRPVTTQAKTPEEVTEVATAADADGLLVRYAPSRRRCSARSTM